MPPPRVPAELPLTVLLMIVAVPPGAVLIAPPSIEAVFPLKVLPVTIKLPVATKTAPPSLDPAPSVPASLPANHEPVTITPVFDLNAPPSLAARLSSKMLVVAVTPPSKALIAPPSDPALLFVKVVRVTLTGPSPVSVWIAPPSPLPSVPASFPSNELSVAVTAPLWLRMAPPSSGEVFPVNLVSVTVTPPVESQIAPPSPLPSVPASFPSNELSVTVMPPAALRRAPPPPAALLLMKVERATVNGPDEASTAPPLEPIVLFPVNVLSSMIIGPVDAASRRRCWRRCCS